MADNLATTILNSSDIDTVREGVPAYLLLVDSFLRGSPDEINLLLAASSLNGSYSIFTEPDRSKMLNQKALDYAMRAVCLSKAQLCDLQSISFAEFENRIAGLAVQDTTCGPFSGNKSTTQDGVNRGTARVHRSFRLWRTAPRPVSRLSTRGSFPLAGTEAHRRWARDDRPARSPRQRRNARWRPRDGRPA